MQFIMAFMSVRISGQTMFSPLHLVIQQETAKFQNSAFRLSVMLCLICFD